MVEQSSGVLIQVASFILEHDQCVFAMSPEKVEKRRLRVKCVGQHQSKGARIEPDLSFDPVTRRLSGGRLHATTADGSVRTLGVEVVSDTGFHLGAGLYFGFDGHHHGEWRGDLVVDGERIADCTDPATARRLHQIRDTVIHVTDPTGGGEGWGNCQPIITGGDEALGLDAADSFL